jgi:hypothetical protein
MTVFFLPREAFYDTATTPVTLLLIVVPSFSPLTTRADSTVTFINTNAVHLNDGATNTLDSSPLYFCDPDGTNFSKRFYRLLAP